MRNGVRLEARKRRVVEALAFVAVLAFLGTSSSARSESAYSDYPDAIAVLGHSGATGESSDPKRPGVEIRANSWATGTNPAVNSVYLRILAKNPRIDGHNINLAQGGATVRELQRQAEQAVSLKPDLVLIQIMDNDMVCPATRSDYTRFGAGLAIALETLARGLPNSNIFVVSQFGSPPSYVRSLSRAERRAIGGTGPCDFADTTGKIIPAKAARLDRTTHGYEAQLAARCKAIPHCRYDGGAFGRIVDKREHTSAGDRGHFSVKGHAKAAAVAWAALRRTQLIP